MRYVLPSPLKGVDTVTPISAMQEGYAITIDNFSPENEKLKVRSGYQLYKKLDCSGDVATLIPMDEIDDILAAAGGNIYLVKSGKLIGLDFNTQSKFIWTYYKNRIFLCNGIDNAQVFDGKVLREINFDEPGDKRFAWVNVINNQLIFGYENSLAFYFAPVGNISGNLSRFDLSQISRLGGYIVNAATWGSDSSAGYHQWGAFITNNGEIIVYNNPVFSDAAKINIVGVFRCPRPIGRNSILNWGSDIVLATESGYIPFSAIISNGNILKQSELFSNKINGYIVGKEKEVDSFACNSIVCTQKNFALFNFRTGYKSDQHVINLTTGAWARFVDIPALYWTEFKGNILFGSYDGKIFSLSGQDDDGNAIKCKIVNYYSNFGVQNQKLLKLFNTRTTSDGEVKIGFGLGLNYEPVSTRLIPDVSYGGFYWASADEPDTGEKWNDGFWVGGENTQNIWRSISGYCNNASLEIGAILKGINLSIYETTFEVEFANGAI